MKIEDIDTYYILDENEEVLEIVETFLYTDALEQRDMIAERLGVDSESLEIVTREEMEENEAAPDEEPETVSNAEDKRSPLIKDNSDRYFYYLEHGHWPSDDEVLAGADVPCTGDYGLSDCLVVTQSTLDFVDAFFT